MQNGRRWIRPGRDGSAPDATSAITPVANNHDRHTGFGPTTRIHSDTLAVIARDGLGRDPRDLELHRPPAQARL